MKRNSKLMRLTCLIFFITFLALPIHSLADEKIAYDTILSIGSVKGSVGEVVEVPVKINQPKKEIATYGIEINYDKTSLEVIGIQPGYGSADTACSEETNGCFWSNFDNEQGFLRTAWADPTAGSHPINQEVELFTIQVKVKTTDFIGEKELSVQVDDPEALSFTDSISQTLSVGVETGKFAIVPPVKEDTKDDGKLPEKEETRNESKSPEKNTNVGSLPKTGDDGYIDTYLNISIALLGAILLSMWLIKRRKILNRE